MRSIIFLVLLTAMVPCRAERPESAGQTISIGQPMPAPPWATSQLQALETIRAECDQFLRLFVNEDGSAGVKFWNGTLDDVMEGFYPWDKFLVLAGTDHQRDMMRRIWKYHWGVGVREGWLRDGYYTTGYDAEHSGECFPMLWMCLELFPEDRELIATNRAMADVMLGERWFHPEKHLFRTSWIATRPVDDPEEIEIQKRFAGDHAINTELSYGPWLAYLTTGRQAYRQWVLQYAKAWNDLARRNDGFFPYHVDTASMKLGPGGDGRWWKGTERGTAGFDYERYGPIIASRGLRGLFAAAALLDTADASWATGLESTVETVFRHGDEIGLPASSYMGPEVGWNRNKRALWVPVLANAAYNIGWDETLARRMGAYPWKRAGGEEGYAARWFQFTYLGQGSLEEAAEWFDQARTFSQARGRRAASAHAGGFRPTSGDELRAYAPKPSDYKLDSIDGTLWLGDNGRSAAPSLGPVGYFHASGRRGLPEQLAALVRHSRKTSATILLYNAAPTPTILQLTGGYYGEHEIVRIQTGDGKHTIGGRSVLLELPPKSHAEIQLTLRRYAFPPSLTPATPSEPGE